MLHIIESKVSDPKADIDITIKMTDERYFYDDINKHRAILT